MISITNKYKGLRRSHITTVKVWILPCLSLFFFIGALGCARPVDKSSMEELDSKAMAAMATDDKKDLDSLASRLLSLSLHSNNTKMEGKANLYLSAFRPSLSDAESHLRLAHLDRAQEIAEKLGNDSLLCYVYNQRGAWELNKGFSVTAQYWFTRSMEHAARTGSFRMSIPAAMNMSEASRIAGDTLGIAYDLKLFDYARVHKEPLLLFASGFHCALYYAPLAQDTTTLLPYINAMRSMQKEYPDAINYVYATYFFHKKDLAKAEQAILQTDLDSYTDYQLLYAQILFQLGRYGEALQWANKVLQGHNPRASFLELQGLRLKASASAKMGLPEESYSCLSRFEQLRDSLETIHSLDLSRRYKAEYEIDVKDREISEHKARIRSLVISISAIIIIILLILAVLYLWNRRRNQFYREIVRQNMDFVERLSLSEKRLSRRNERIAELERSLARKEECEASATPSQELHSNPSKISDDKVDEIFERIQNLMESSQIWRDTNITRDILAEKVGCNRTYLTEIIKSKTGMGYSQYMNSCRIREAIRLLSDPSVTTPLKEMAKELGFLSVQSFYNAFRQTTGVPPAAFRKTAREIQNHE